MRKFSLFNHKIKARLVFFFARIFWKQKKARIVSKDILRKRKHPEIWRQHSEHKTASFIFFRISKCSESILLFIIIIRKKLYSKNNNNGKNKNKSKKKCQYALFRKIMPMPYQYHLLFFFLFFFVIAVGGKNVAPAEQSLTSGWVQPDQWTSTPLYFSE